MIPSWTTSPEWAAYGAALVGAVFVGAAVVKAANPGPFVDHLGRLGILGRRHLFPAAVAAVGLESAWGAALISGVVPGVVLPATLALLVALTGLTLWSTSTGRTEDCGCYGGRLDVSPGQSAALNAVYAVLVVVAWRALDARGAMAPPTAWQAGAAIGAGLATVGLAVVARRYARAHGEPLVGRSPLREGRRWNERWAAGVVGRAAIGEVIVVYLGPSCPHCHHWGRILNVIDQVPDLPAVVGVVSVPEQERDAFKQTHGLRFPIVSIRRSLMDRLVSAVPTSVLVEGGVIRKLWLGSMPEQGFFDRFKRALFPALAGRAREEGSEEGGASE